MLDRVLPENVRYPADYGFVPSTEGADGEPLDAMVAAYEPVFPGCVLKARIVGALEMAEGGETEYTIFAVPEGDAHFDDIKTLEGMPERTCARSSNSSPPSSGWKGTRTWRSRAGTASKRPTI